MNDPIGAAESAARRILAFEAGESDVAQISIASRTIEKMRLNLTKFVGASGFRALLSRALAVAWTRAPWLASVQVTAGGTLEGFDEAARMQDADEAMRGEMALLTELFVLLITFIGENITLQMARDVWPHARLDHLNSSVKEPMQ
jgi:hypothetical protein